MKIMTVAAFFVVFGIDLNAAELDWAKSGNQEAVSVPVGEPVAVTPRKNEWERTGLPSSILGDVTYGSHPALPADFVASNTNQPWMHFAYNFMAYVFDTPRKDFRWLRLVRGYWTVATEEGNSWNVYTASASARIGGVNYSKEEPLVEKQWWSDMPNLDPWGQPAGNDRKDGNDRHSAIIGDSGTVFAFALSDIPGGPGRIPHQWQGNRMCKIEWHLDFMIVLYGAGFNEIYRYTFGLRGVSLAPGVVRDPLAEEPYLTEIEDPADRVQIVKKRSWPYP